METFDLRRPQDTLVPFVLIIQSHTCVMLSRFLAGSPTSEAESRLYHYLFDIYNPLIRPVQNVTETITIEFNLALSQIINVVSSLTCSPGGISRKGH